MFLVCCLFKICSLVHKDISVRTLCVGAATDLCSNLHRNVHFVPTKHVARRDGCLRQVAMGGVCAAH